MESKTTKEKKHSEELFKLMQENPELPVIPFVDAEIIGNDSGYWLGSWGSAMIDEYIIPPDGDYPAQFKSDDDVFDTLEKCLGYEEFEKLPETEEECRPYYEDLPWKKAIIVYINLPE